jgi:hypothetical protein
MPVMNFDLEDGLPPVSFSLKSDDCDRFMAFMAECQAIKEAQPKREWVGLTDEEREELMDNYDVASPDYAKAIEAKLREKNSL